MKVFELSEQQKSQLKEMFGDWVRFDEERIYYDHDIGTIPKLLRPAVGRTVPAAVVKAQSEEDVSRLLKWAYENSVPVVPRAAATSGYGE